MSKFRVHNTTSLITTVQFQVVVDSEDPQMVIGLLDLYAKDVGGEAEGTLTYDIFKDGWAIKFNLTIYS